MLAFASNPVRTHVFNPNTSGLVSIEKITVLQYYGGIVWDGLVVVPLPEIRLLSRLGLPRLINSLIPFMVFLNV